jgi:hypothetical protein
MTDMDDETLDAVIVAEAAVLGLPLDPSWMPSIRTHLRVTLDHAARAGSFVLPDEAEPAPIFKA